MTTSAIRLFTVPAGSKIEQTGEGKFIVFHPDGGAELVDVTLTPTGPHVVRSNIPPITLTAGKA